MSLGQWWIPHLPMEKKGHPQQSVNSRTVIRCEFEYAVSMIQYDSVWNSQTMDLVYSN